MQEWFKLHRYLMQENIFVPIRMSVDWNTLKIFRHNLIKNTLISSVARQSLSFFTKFFRKKEAHFFRFIGE